LQALDDLLTTLDTHLTQLGVDPSSVGKAKGKKGAKMDRKPGKLSEVREISGDAKSSAVSSDAKLVDEASGIITCDNFINDEYIPPASGKYMDVFGPRDGALIGRVALSSTEDVARAVEAGKAAYAKWSMWTVKERMVPLLKLRHLLASPAVEQEICELIMLEHGKNVVEALGSLRKGNETVEWACGMPALIPGKCMEVSHGVECRERRLPHGVCTSIVPFNFPAMVPMWTTPICIATGNVMILKPSEKVPLTANYLAKLFLEAGFPPGVFQIINGAADAVTSLVDNGDIKALSFVGSTKVAELVYKRCKAQSPPKRALCMGGAKNHLVAVADCNLEMASTDVVNSFCGCTGQRCMAASVLLLVGEGKEQDALLKLICEKAAELKPGKGKRELGPVIDAASLKRITSYIDKAEADGMKVLVDGRSWTKDKTEGFWVGPTVIEFSDPTHPSACDEIFGPVLAVIRVPDGEAAIAIENGNEYGNAACIYTSTGATADWFVSRFSAGMIGVNVGVPVPREPFAFGGVNLSRFGDSDITADGGLEFWTWRKKITTKWAPSKKKTWMD
jgi:methylmalonic acid semialdehyde dehydrogenase